MGKDYSFNIFDASANKPGHSLKKPPIKAKEETPSLSLQPESAIQLPPPHIPSEEELLEIFKKIYSMRDDLEKKFESFYEKSGFSPKELESFFSNPNNFSIEKWEKLQSMRESLENKIQTFVGVPVKSAKNKSKTASAKERKGKTIGARKKWIPMR